jgi:putative hydrolase of the HAD superfamily
VIRAILLDLDDTIMDHRSASDRAVVAWARSLGVDEDAALLAERWRAVSHHHYARFQRREVDAGEQQRARVREFLPHLDLRRDADAQVVVDAYVALYRAAWTPFPDAGPAVHRCRAAGLAVGVLTNGVHELQAAKLDRAGLTDAVDAFVASSTLPWSKPDPRAFHAACAALDIRPADTLMVGDSLLLDVHGARAAGLPAALLDRDGTSPDADLRGGVRIRSLEALASVAARPAG